MVKSRYSNIITEEYLRTNYVLNKKSMNQISKEVGCNHKTIASFLHFYGINQVPQSNGRKMRAHARWSGYGDLSLTQFNNIKNNARIRKIDFDFSIAEFWEQYVKQNGRCALSGVEIGFVHCKRGNASLDRIDSTRGYVKGNIWWVHKDVNLAKQSLSSEEFVSLCRRVVTHFDK